MGLEKSGYSPNILIFLEVDGKRIALSDLLYNSARLSEIIEVAPQTVASLIFSVNGLEEREEVILESGISNGDSLISFAYADSGRINSRHFSI